MKKRFIEISRGKFAYREGGEKDKPAVVFIHGWPESSVCWENVVAEIPENYYFFAPDLRGMGESNKDTNPALYLKNELAADVVELLDKKGIKDFFLVGHDWGGIVAQEVALAIPERIKKIALMNIPVILNMKVNNKVLSELSALGIAPYYWYQFFQQTPSIPEAFLKGNEKIWLDFVLTMYDKEKSFDEKSKKAYLRAYRSKGAVTCMANLYRTYPKDIERWNLLKKKRFELDCLYIYGNKDVVVVKEYLKGVENCFKSFEYHEFDAAHFVQEECFKETAQLLTNFFSSNSVT